MRGFLERHFKLVDLVIVVLASAVVVIFGHWLDHDDRVLSALNGSRGSVYGAIAGLFGTVFGFALTAMSIVLAFAESPRLSILRKSRHWLTLWAVFTGGIRVFIGVAILAIAAMIFDKDSHPRVVLVYGVIFAVFLGLTRLFRIIWAFQKLVFIMTQPDAADSHWRSPTERREEVARLR